MGNVQMDPMAFTYLPRTSPESVGVSSPNIVAFVQAVNRSGIGLHSFMLLRKGAVIAEGWWEPYQKHDVHLLYSLSKSFTSTAVGLAVQDGSLSLDDPVISFFPDETPTNPCENLKAMKVRHLLSMSCGHAKDDMADMYAREDGNWVRGFLERDVEFKPGTHFLYNSSASYILSAIVQHVTGSTVLDYLGPRLLDPIGIEQATWEMSPQGINTGGWGMSVTTEAIARFGQLYLQKGAWNGQIIMSEEWIAEATRAHVSNGSNPDSDWEQGYGFQFWRCRNDCYRGDGAFGQYCIVMPDKEMVVAITSAVDNMQDVLNLVWEHLLPAVKSDRLTEDYAAQRALARELVALQLTGPEGYSVSTLRDTISGKTYRRSEGEGDIQWCRFDLSPSEGFGPGECRLTICRGGIEHTIRAGGVEWIHGESDIETPGQKIAAFGAWVKDDLYEMKIVDTRSPSGATIRASFSGDRVELTTTLQYRFGPPEGPSFVGQAC